MAAFKIFRKFADLLDRSTVDLPAINTPLADALAGKATSAQGALADTAVQEGDSPNFVDVTASGTVTVGVNSQFYESDDLILNNNTDGIKFRFAGADKLKILNASIQLLSNTSITGNLTASGTVTAAGVTATGTVTTPKIAQTSGGNLYCEISGSADGLGVKRASNTYAGAVYGANVSLSRFSVIGWNGTANQAKYDGGSEHDVILSRDSAGVLKTTGSSLITGTVTAAGFKYDANTFTSVTASRALTSADHGKTLLCDSASAIDIDVVSGLPVNFWCSVVQLGAGVVTLTDNAGATTLNNANGLATSAQFAGLSVANYGTTDTYLVS